MIISAQPITIEHIHQALAVVEDPEIHRPITELDMVGAITIDAAHVDVRILLTVAACPLRERITHDVRSAVLAIDGISTVTVEFGVMSDEQRTALRRKVRGDEPSIPFSEPGSRTRVYCVVSGKGGVGKSSVTVNLAAALAARNVRVGILDADIHGHSIPSMLGLRTGPTQVDRMLMPPTAHGIKVISVGMFVEDNEPVLWRGPMLHRALRQFLTDVYWGDLDVLLVDLPPGTGDIAISLAQMLPSAELLVVTTPQTTAAQIAERAGAVAAQTKQRVVGIVENMSWYDAPDGTRRTLFGAGGGARVSERLSGLLATDCPVLGHIPFDPEFSATSDHGTPMVLSAPDSPATAVFFDIVRALIPVPRSLVGLRLTVTPG
ncbi:Mrp/NBP35 family ATP-binding protein [Nocardia sp. NBC_01503]|uniref:Mrp/NBP35 family ATP-binding protein n=1 Tax=Nocardia sp. NBC_01503 TaxID=2975997 RepID=UPI002E7BADE7|nr:Mrp/NBP35 family ATP-binding protein [Nocardia sp. NBC_01503]WTL30974.1 Mrp/NBP35 family ATP-binding protein [Nocardia sp. NBC_01503]